ncbi:MAG: hypothetical protein VB013_06690 [Anaerolineaceae bacterium]|jgi:hypothetical protein|nr:hypothetical protein [Anaerolineaceae bacterium]
MSLWLMMLIIFAAGAVGGIVNALLSDNGFILPKPEKIGENRIIRPGFLGNILISGIASCVSWGLYGPFATISMIGPSGSENAGLTLASLVGAVLVGVGGARWLTNEVDKTLLKAAASEAAAGPANITSSRSIAMATPMEAFRIASIK